MLLANEFFPTLSGGKGGGEKLVTEAVANGRYGTEVAMGPGAKAWKRLNQRDPETGAPQGALAVMRERMLRMVTLRARKMFSRRYGRSSLQPSYT